MFCIRLWLAAAEFDAVFAPEASQQQVSSQRQAHGVCVSLASCDHADLPEVIDQHCVNQQSM
jgi:hypothetical protein